MINEIAPFYQYIIAGAVVLVGLFFIIDSYVTEAADQLDREQINVQLNNLGAAINSLQTQVNKFDWDISLDHNIVRHNEQLDALAFYEQTPKGIIALLKAAPGINAELDNLLEKFDREISHLHGLVKVNKADADKVRDSLTNRMWELDVEVGNRLNRLSPKRKLKKKVTKK